MDKREQLVVSAFELFYREGVHAVGINRVLSESGVAKKTLYHHFAGKEELVAATVLYRHQYYMAWLGEHLARAAPGRMALQAMFSALDAWFNLNDPAMPVFHGCYFINVSAEFGAQGHPLHRQCAAHKTELKALIGQHLALFIADADRVGYLQEAIALLQEGAIVQAHVTGDSDAAAKAWQVVEQLLPEF
ncbi:TetR/AcrR family transcriptional regulator [Marinobacterium marinum]|uniref:TetR/AcrR family transcriptional regulator n=1 Tax=Marinobacterium marinum TaxID=2756129 RepID=A0A7W2ACM7_9GAMM|nr:TetR/AcrR family transcriptional regulator [Marinobacterium marinum]MBA4502664.1 TetR/AcrR family transcriptional regulator [Marinobacterium marinum]